ncbi:uncharacterized protein LOC106177466 isoform X1 [Lingula anatina]|uniref:Uncharacterized protein LOC106177466 isoform X1 n=1 Tax=Lingula anatina TaxID=7574 RepID=A0A1S3JZ67_LINAN|nr:uncharacterized protein LOC106177466 isoform X1 [Lingula anatina]|eukprot:XP_013415688.1 uncharacterized protein LOC106177466 isoform X1 [Lingula anatina]
MDAKSHVLLAALMGILAVSFGMVAGVDTECTAVFSMQGVTGNISFMQSAQSGTVSIVAHLNGLKTGKEYGWEVRQFPTNFDIANRCSDLDIGNMLPNGGNLSDSHGFLTPSNQASASYSDSSLHLFGKDSITGRTLRLSATDGTHTVCATIQPTGIVKTVMVRLPGPVGGTIYFREDTSNTRAGVAIYADLFFTDSTSAPSTASYLKIHSNAVAADLTESKSMSERCAALGDVYNPGGVTGTCSSSDHSSCMAGDLQGKFGTVGIGLTKSSQKTFVTDTNLALSGSSSVIGKSLAVYSASDAIIACANIVEVVPKNVSATFSMSGMKGSVRFMQNSPLDPTTVTVNFQNLQNLAGGWHVHAYPLVPKMFADDFQCSGKDVGGHWNPFGIDPSTSPSAGTGTNDEYEVGDLSGKYGSLANMASLMAAVYIDYNLPLFGPNSIIGRSIVIHENMPGSPRWVCANIDYPAETITAKVTFKYPVIGEIIMRQEKNKPLTDTSIFAKLGYANGMTGSSGHNFHVHQTKVSEDFMADTGRCMSAKAHFNPYDSYMQGNYATECSENNPLRCELGDLSGKHTTLSIGDSSGGFTHAFFTDILLPLSGPHSVIGLSVVIHVGAGRLACGDIYEVKPMVAEVTSWSAGGPTGTFTFTQNSMFDMTEVSINMANLGANAGGYHVHVLPVPDGMNSPCSSKGVQGHFNPYNITVANSPAAGTGTNDEYEVGDMSGKYGMMNTMNSMAMVKEDNNLPLFGPQSIVGRSIVIHKSDSSGSRWVCGNITAKTGTKVVAIATFDAGVLHGYIKMHQMTYTDGSFSDTTIEMDLKYANGTQTTNDHNWHVHESKVGSDGTVALDKRCKSVGPHYNPYRVNTTGSYSSDCSFSNPLRCEMGDISGKQGQYDIGSGRVLFNDIDLPLHGKFSVIGRSITVHTENGGGGRLACADIVEVKAPTPSPNTDNTVSGAVTYKWNLAVMLLCLVVMCWNI